MASSAFATSYEEFTTGAKQTIQLGAQIASRVRGLDLGTSIRVLIH